jgi:hypothetical protein
MNNNVITELKVIFLYDETGFCRDVFKTATGTAICRLQEKYGGKEHVSRYTLGPAAETILIIF